MESIDKGFIMVEQDEVDFIWVFNGAGAQFPCGIFQSRKCAEEHIRKYNMSGILTKYPIDRTVYEWAVNTNTFVPASRKQCSADFVQRFSSAHLEHYHYENGQVD